MWEDMQRAGRVREAEDDTVGAPETQRVVSGTTFQGARSSPVVCGGVSPAATRATEVRTEGEAASAPREAMATLPDGIPAAAWYPEPGDQEALPDSVGTPATTPSPVLSSKAPAAEVGANKRERPGS